MNQPPGYGPGGYPPQGGSPGYTPPHTGYPQYAPQHAPHGYPPHPPPQKKGPRPLAIILGVVLALTIGLAIGVYLLAAASRTPEAQLGGSPGVAGLIGNAVRAPQTILDEQIAIPAHAWQSRSFSLPEPRNVQLTAEGLSNADKGFMLYVMPTNECASFKPGMTIHPLPSFEGMKVRQFTNTGPMPQGQSCVLVENSENIINGMIVHLKLVSDPK